MTASSFQQKIKGIYGPEFRTSKWTTWLLLTVVLCVFVALLVHAWGFQAHRPWKLLLLPALYVLLIAYGIWCRKKAHRIHQFDSPKTIQEKTTIIENYTTGLNVVWRYSEGNYHSITYRNRLFIRIDLRFYIDQNKILANVQPTANYITRRKNHLNIGLAHSATKKLQQYLETQL